VHKINSLLCGFLCLLVGCGSPPADPNPEATVRIVQSPDGHYNLLRHGKPFFIRGASGQAYIPELRRAGGNCLRVYDTLNLQAVLDTAEQYGIAVIADLPMPESRFLDFYRDEEAVKSLYRAHRRTVRRYKDHPALLMWMLGNELDFPYKPNYRPFYRAYNDCLSMIKQEGRNHPVATALTNFNRRPVTNLQWKVPGLDLLAINTFGMLTSLEEELDAFEWMWDGPYIVSEWGINGYWEESKTAWQAPLEHSGRKKAEQLQKRYWTAMPLDDPRFLGSLMFYWGHKQEATDTWFNAFTAQGRPTELYYGFAQLWQDEPIPYRVPPLRYVLINEQGGQDSPLLKAGAVQQARLQLRQTVKKPLQVNWVLRAEDWFSLELDTVPAIRKYPKLLLQQDSNALKFRAPREEGPYRLFAYLSYPEGAVTTVNIPFYVVR